MAVLTFCAGKCCMYDKYKDHVSQPGIEQRLQEPLPEDYNPIGKSLEQILADIEFKQILAEVKIAESEIELTWTKIDDRSE